jgi:predicted nucleic acid-binding Zn ribbon protein
VQRLIKDRGWTAPAAVAGVVGRWSDIVGAEIAGHVVPETFDTDQGRLVLRADSSAWASVMKLQATVLSTRIEQEVGPGVVRHVTVLGPSAPSWKHGPLRVKGRGPRDTYG